MKRTALLLVTVSSLAVAAYAATPSKAEKAPPMSALAKRGAYLVHLGGCNHCHTPWKFDEALGMPVPDMSRMLSGHPEKAPEPEGNRGKHDMALIGPTFTSFQMAFGTVFSPNLTPDKDTGLGAWTWEMFLKAFRKGKHMGGDGRAILPPMPWMDIGMLSDQDLKALFVYLQSIPAIRNPVPAHKVPQEAYDKITESFDKLGKRLASMKH